MLHCMNALEHLSSLHSLPYNGLDVCTSVGKKHALLSVLC